MKSQRPSKRHHVHLRRMSKGNVLKNSPIEVPRRTSIHTMKWTLDGWCDDDGSSCSSFVRNSWGRKPFKNKRLPSPQMDPNTVVLVDCHLTQPLSPSSPKPTEVPDHGNISFRTHIRLDRHKRLSDGMSVRSVLGVNRHLNNSEWDDLACSNSRGITTNRSSEVNGLVCETGRDLSAGECESIVMRKDLAELKHDDYSESKSKDRPSQTQPTVEIHPAQPQCLDSDDKESLPTFKANASIVYQSKGTLRPEEGGLWGAVGNSCLSAACGDDQDSISLGDIDLDMESLTDTLRSLNCQCDALPVPFNRAIANQPFHYHRGSISTYSSVTDTSADISSTTESTVGSRSTHGQARLSRFSLRRRKHRSKRTQVLIARRPRKILVLGDMMSGKTNLISSYCKDRYQDQYIPTLFRCVQTDATVRGENINLVVLDISGRDDFAPLRKYAYHKVDTVVFCYPVDSIDSFERIRSFWVPELKAYAPKAPFVVVGTKRDIRDEARDRVEGYKLSLHGKEGETDGRIGVEAEFAKTFVSYDRGKRLSNELSAQGFYECSAMYRDGTRSLFESITMIALKKSRRKRKTSSRHLDTMCSIL